MAQGGLGMDEKRQALLARFKQVAENGLTGTESHIEMALMDEGVKQCSILVANFSKARRGRGIKIVPHWQALPPLM